MYVLALGFDLYPEAETPALLPPGRSAEDRRADWLTPASSGSRYLSGPLPIGRNDLAYALVRRTGYPSWQYSIGHGATTIWERWDGWTEAAASTRRA